jgi:hypothetical protein
VVAIPTIVRLASVVILEALLLKRAILAALNNNNNNNNNNSIKLNSILCHLCAKSTATR